jgi:galactokinase
MDNTQKTTINAFIDQFGESPAFVVRAPGRVNLIGEHTDYNDGFVLPMAIERAIWIAARPRAEQTVRLHSLEWGETAVFSLIHLQKESGWIEYVKGVAWALQTAGLETAGWEGVISGDIPQGAGLSSSAALELAAARTFQAVAGWNWQPTQMAQLSQQAENEWVGVNCGIMDQLIVAAGQAGHALLIDCRHLTTTAVPLPPATTVVILDTATRRGLVDSAYNERRQQCEAVAAFFGVAALRDVARNTLTASEPALTPLQYRRARHVITENERTQQAAVAMQQSDTTLLGRLMNDSHASLRDDFEVSSRELNVMVEIAQAQSGCYGARMTGAGFGGCAVALVASDRVEAFVTAVASQYQQTTNLIPHIYISQPSAGTAVV